MIKEFKIAIKIQKETGLEISFRGLIKIKEYIKENYPEDEIIESIKSCKLNFV